jgi:4'-phosphopantetheinyl transferase
MELKPSGPQALPERGSIDIWHFRVDEASLVSTEALAQTLSDEERLTASRFRLDLQRLRYIANHATARAILASYAQGVMLRTTPYGKPYVAGPEAAKRLRFNMTHSGALCVIAIAAQEVGVDVERVRSDIAVDEIAQIYFTPQELAALRRLPAQRRADAFFACWTRKEALLKAYGTGFIRPPQTVHVGLGAHDVAADFNGWSVVEIELPSGYAGAIAAEGTQISVHVRDWRM